MFLLSLFLPLSRKGVFSVSVCAVVFHPQSNYNRLYCDCQLHASFNLYNLIVASYLLVTTCPATVYSLLSSLATYSALLPIPAYILVTLTSDLTTEQYLTYFKLDVIFDFCTIVELDFTAKLYVCS